MRQEAPDPKELQDLVDNLHYKSYIQVWLEDKDRGQGSEGLTLVIYITTPNAYNHEQTRNVYHYMIVPAAAYDRRSWKRWLFDQLLLVEQHEACEFFEIEGEGKPYAPSHAPGSDPYTIRELSTEMDQRTSFRGDVNPKKEHDGN